jgi:hypothetical protein
LQNNTEPLVDTFFQFNSKLLHITNLLHLKISVIIIIKIPPNQYDINNFLSIFRKMSNISSKMPVFIDRTDLNDNPIPIPNWPRQLPKNDNPVFVDRTDLLDCQIPYPKWPRKLPNQTIKQKQYQNI